MVVKYVSLCSGVGTDTFSFKRLKIPHKCVLWSEKDEFAQETHNLNHPEYSERLQEDLTTIDWDKVEDFDFLLSGFPCQPFSMAGKRGGLEDARGTIFFHLAKALDIKRPKFFLFENVVGLMSHDKGKTYRTIINIIEELGYFCYGRVYNTKDFGIPHNRSRLWMIGFREFNDFINFKTAFDKKEPRDLREYLDQNVSSKYGISKASYERMSEAMKDIKNPSSIYVIDHGASPRYQVAMENVVPCLKATRADYALFPLKRRLTPRECFRLQGFKDDELLLSVSDTQAYKQAGNGWTVDVSTAIIERMLMTDEKYRLRNLNL